MFLLLVLTKKPSKEIKTLRKHLWGGRPVRPVLGASALYLGD